MEHYFAKNIRERNWAYLLCGRAGWMDPFQPEYPLRGLDGFDLLDDPPQDWMGDYDCIPFFEPSFRLGDSPDKHIIAR